MIDDLSKDVVESDYNEDITKECVDKMRELAAPYINNEEWEEIDRAW